MTTLNLILICGTVVILAIVVGIVVITAMGIDRDKSFWEDN